MTKLEKSAEDYANDNCTSCNHRGTYGPCICNKLELAFIAGASRISGVFAEWTHEQCYVWWNGLWERDGEEYTTAELYQLWQQSL